jgi:hypothetical protein
LTEGYPVSARAAHIKHAPSHGVIKKLDPMAGKFFAPKAPPLDALALMD